MEKFMFIFKGTDDEELNLSPEEKQAHMQKWYKWVENLANANKYVGGDPLQKGGKILSKNGNRVVVTDGPFPEAKELVGGYTIITAKDINEAAELAKDCPCFEFGGSIELRPIMNIDM